MLVIKLFLELQASSKYRYNHRAWLDDQNEKEEGLTGTNAFDPSRSKPEKLKHPLAMRKVVKYPDKLGERISTQIKVRPDQKQVRWLCVDLLD